jgi:phosphate transport system substrate-binding protein
MASGDLPAGLAKWALKQPAEYSQIIIAYDALAVIVHPANPLSNLSISDLREIFSGRITNWKSLGWGSGGEIQVCAHDASRGAFGTWRKFVMGDKDHVTFDAKIFESNLMLGDAVLANPHAIGTWYRLWQQNQSSRCLRSIISFLRKNRFQSASIQFVKSYAC